MQAPFPYTDHILPLLQSSVSATRLQRYLAMANGDTAQALRLYMWNTALSEALYGPLQGLEITLRNKVHECLSRSFGAQWYDAPATGLLSAQQQQILEAKQTLTRLGKSLDPGRVVAELNFGFWVGLFASRYENPLWRRHLRTVFVNAAAPFVRNDAHRVLNEIRFLRNRIAHHESILQRPLRAEHGMILTTIRWFCAATADWVAHHSRFDNVHATQP